MTNPGADPEPLADRLRGFGETIFAEMTRLAREHDAVNLGQGFPEFDGPEFVREAAVDAIRSGVNQYARGPGDPELVRAIADDVGARHNLDIDPMTQVAVTAGCTEAIHSALMALVRPGDEVVLIEPYYDSYRACVSMAGGVPRFVTLHAPDFRWEPEELRAAFTERTRLVLLNTPHNPTGRVLDADELQQIENLCTEFDALCVSDEVYDRLVFDGEHRAIGARPGMRERTLTLNSAGKTFSLTGWKVGWAWGPEPLVRSLVTAHQFVTFCAAAPLQRAVATALRGPDEHHERFLAGYRERREVLVDGLMEAGFGVTPPQGTYFVPADIRPLGWDDDREFCRMLVEEVGVAAIPMSCFYENTERGRFLVRFAFCKTIETLRAGVERLRGIPRP